MKKDFGSWFRKIGYEEGFGIGEMLSSHLGKKRIDIHTIVSGAGRVERKNKFGEDGILCFFTCVIAPCR